MEHLDDKTRIEVSNFLRTELAKIGLSEGDHSLNNILWEKIAHPVELKQLKKLWKLYELCLSKGLYDPAKGWDNIKVYNGRLMFGFHLHGLLTKRGKYPMPHFQVAIRMIHNIYTPYEEREQ